MSTPGSSTPASKPAPSSHPKPGGAAQGKGAGGPHVKGDPSATRLLKPAGEKMPRPRTVPFPSRRAGVVHSSAKLWLADEAFAEAQGKYQKLNSFLWYCSPDVAPPASNQKWDHLKNMFDAAWGAGVVPQIGFEFNQDLDLVNAELGKEGSQIHQQVVTWAQTLRGSHAVYLRPLSEMNDGGNNWSLTPPQPGEKPPHKQHSAKTYIQAWVRLHDIFDAAGATNVLWCFDVYEYKAQMTARGFVEQALENIPAGYIDALGVHPYTRMPGGSNPFATFAECVDGWLAVFAGSRHRSTRRIIGEMGVADNSARLPENAAAPGALIAPKWDKLRASWVHDAFQHARSRFDLVTYFNQVDKTWAIREHHSPAAWAELQRQLGAY